ncbi:pisatin demethylase [Fusarium albosuccineum]|uniref:Pisatin demethylase n=1 Tax=Fusarium albosuccineum TaxID=1237068 RepID=A0A8H4LF74_9HYPO|nr:pisatin demethylase [Fusarium albosuccineum]
MRVHPSVGLTLPRHVPKGGCQIAGEWFPEGTRVGVNAAVIHFNKDIFGHDAEKFNPDRWFREGAANMDRYMFQFGGGSRTCIGKNISLCEMYKLVPQLLLSFDLEDMGTEWTTHNYWLNKLSKVFTWKGLEVEMNPVLPVSARADRAIAKLHRAIYSRNGLDVTLLFTGEVARLLTVVLVLIHQSTQGAQQSRLPGGAVKYALSKIPRTWGLGKAFASCSGQASTRMRALSDILEEWQMMHRLCGLLDVWASVKELVWRSTTDAHKEPTQRLKFWIEALQSLSLTSFHVCEATALLSSKRFLAWSEPMQERLSYLSIRSWAAFTFLDLARLLLDKPKLDASESKVHDNRNIAWRKEFLRTLAWAPVTVHWGLRGGLLPEIIASLLAVYATSGLMEEVWQDIA